MINPMRARQCRPCGPSISRRPTPLMAKAEGRTWVRPGYRIFRAHNLKLWIYSRLGLCVWKPRIRGSLSPAFASFEAWEAIVKGAKEPPPRRADPFLERCRCGSGGAKELAAFAVCNHPLSFLLLLARMLQGSILFAFFISLVRCSRSRERTWPRHPEVSVPFDP